MKGLAALEEGRPTPRSWEAKNDDDKKELKSEVEGPVMRILANNDGKMSFDEAWKAFLIHLFESESGGEDKLPADPDEAKQAVIKMLDGMTMTNFWSTVDMWRDVGQASTGKLVF